MKRKRFGRLLPAMAALMATAMVATACGGGDSGDASDSGNGGGGSKELTIGYIAWDEDIALSNLFKAQLEEKGYTVTLQQLDVAPTYQALAKGDIDLFLDAWLPTTHEQYWEQYKDDLEDLGSWYSDATLNLAVPAYVENVNSIADLKDNADMFGGTITGIDPGAGEMRIVQEEVIPQYELDGALKLQSSSSTAMLTSLDKAIKNQDPIVVTLWHPHWAYSRYDLKDLEDPKGAMGEGEELHMLGRKGFSEDFPALTNMIKSFKVTDEQLGALEDEIQKAGSGNELQAAQDWASQNKEVVDKLFAGA
ncbi:glycine/betaine ABC transporter substrate-binding protein [Prauserella marina]|uniref:Glycine betaine/proline transport system substrate-binding protein n=1 Tax=Prauserella marina TaxID=530584 RepID=A0A222VTV4_9PSEU|nr:glycine betaine ABC transporter substrate-binding protein [Prauserella marina]ASR37344.1 glycine/betaine ABC transporter substrate-binding protein [Prauserella marina]PWV74794.1 glycine betaine/proline transport system substrate-binding protein [Prauserella marina]SDD40531.1 glycine betaine/proline transport system substrate-binding protein [Prauserella marina]